MRASLARWTTVRVRSLALDARALHSAGLYTVLYPAERSRGSTGELVPDVVLMDLRGIHPAAVGGRPFTAGVLQRVVDAALTAHRGAAVPVAEPDPAVAVPADVTRRGDEVLALVAEGLGNAEIGARSR